MKYTSIFIILLNLLLVFNFVNAESGQINITNDAYVRQQYPNNNYGSLTQLYASNTYLNRQYYSYIYTNLTFLNINDSTLGFLNFTFRLSQDSYRPNGNCSTMFYICNTTFSESVITWNNQDYSNCYVNPVYFFVTELASNRQSFDILPYLKLNNEISIFTRMNASCGIDNYYSSTIVSSESSTISERPYYIYNITSNINYPVESGNIINPLNNSIIYTNYLNVTWENFTDLNIEDTIIYNVYLNDTLICKDILNEYCLITDLTIYDNFKNYTIKVIGQDSFTFAEIQHNIYLNYNTPPKSFYILQPLNNSVVESSTFILRWNESKDSESLPQYLIYINNSFLSSTYNLFSVITLDESNLYNIQVKSYDGEYFNYSDILEIYTINSGNIVNINIDEKPFYLILFLSLYIFLFVIMIISNITELKIIVSLYGIFFSLYLLSNSNIPNFTALIFTFFNLIILFTTINKNK